MKHVINIDTIYDQITPIVKLQTEIRLQVQMAVLSSILFSLHHHW